MIVLCIPLDELVALDLLVPVRPMTSNADRRFAILVDGGSESEYMCVCRNVEGSGGNVSSASPEAEIAPSLGK